MFKIGDRVKVVAMLEDDGAPWIDEMSDLLESGTTGEVYYIYPCSDDGRDETWVRFKHDSHERDLSLAFLGACLELVEDKKIETTDKSNPKAAIGATALPMTMLSPLARAMGALGKYNGMLKYGLANFIGTEVRMSVYLDAIERHLDAIKLGEDADPVDKVPHWGAIMANIDIIICAQAAGTLIDDRPRSDGQLEALRALKPLVAGLQEVHAGKTPHHYYMKNKDADSKDS